MTSARPIISAAAVEAVRAGFRIAFSRASVPDDATDAGAGSAEDAPTSGARTCGATSAMPMNERMTPTPTASSRSPVGALLTSVP